MCNMVAKTLENYIQYFLHLFLYYLCEILGTAFVLRVLLSSYVYLLYLIFLCFKRIICVFVVSHVYLLYILCVFVILCVLLFLH
jgi:hypothetical protein